jgi:hypothetical protein
MRAGISDNKVTGFWQDNWFSIPDKGKDFSFHHYRAETCSGATQWPV